MSLYDEIIKLALERNFFFPSSEIYGDAPAGFYEYGPLGISMKNKYIEAWRRELIRRDEMVEIDGSQIMPKRVFVASGHLESFTDPITKCTSCNAIFRADKLLEEVLRIPVPERLDTKEMDRLISEHNVSCPSCKGKLDKVSKFNMMFKVNVGASGDECYLRPETCQSIFVDFIRIYKTMRKKLPFAIAQYGKSFRNEISPRQSLMRLREFYQAEIEVFFNPKKANDFPKAREYEDYVLRLKPLDEDKVVKVSCKESVETGLTSSMLVAYYLALIQRFYQVVGIDMERFRLRQLSDEERAFYAKEAWDVEVLTSIGWIELVACNNRTDYDLSGHSRVSGQDLSVYDDGEKIIPHVFELSMGVDRSLFCILEHSYAKEGDRTVLKLPPTLAPVQVAVFPLVTKDGLDKKAREVYEALKLDFDAVYDESGSIGRRYRRQDEIGTPFCVTVDYQTMEDETVTVRERDTMAQERVPIKELKKYLEEKLRY
ncbi:MAG: glycine--tRNA ligase [Candidatus Terraquivivens tikiterensis]|uniref:glycine--tRNA ligase n=1 Tax=Candidatus Terraquivivens tikiterensis TaxID=1980982 RepID=A0A2R7Y699_9ARCH|nr:MAG: glycine--tRNA ligase [Candidatus Terraquivivens tikiterensis]